MTDIIAFPDRRAPQPISQCQRRLGDNPDPRDLRKPIPMELMKMWPIGRQVGNVKNIGPDILDEVEPNPGTPL